MRDVKLALREAGLVGGAIPLGMVVVDAALAVAEVGSTVEGADGALRVDNGDTSSPDSISLSVPVALALLSLSDSTSACLRWRGSEREVNMALVVVIAPMALGSVVVDGRVASTVTEVLGAEFDSTGVAKADPSLLTEGDTV